MFQPMVLVPKAGELFWFCLDFRIINVVSKFDEYPITFVDELLDWLGSAGFYSTLDLTKGQSLLQTCLLFPHAISYPESVARSNWRKDTGMHFTVVILSTTLLNIMQHITEHSVQKITDFGSEYIYWSGLGIILPRIKKMPSWILNCWNFLKTQRNKPNQILFLVQSVHA